MMFWSTTTPLPAGVITMELTAGVRRNRSAYASCSYFRQHISRPQVPEILTGFRDSPCSFAILMETGWNPLRNDEQQNGLPQMPRPPSIFASSRTPICRSSMRVRNTDARSLTSSRKSTRPSAVK